MWIKTILTGVALSVASHAVAQDKNFYVRSGPAVLLLSEGAKVKAAGTPIPGTIDIDNHVTGTIEIGYSFSNNFSIGFTGGFPPTIDVHGAGALAPLGKLGTVTYGPTALTAQYTFTEFGRIQPYIGAGPMFMFIFDNKDAALSNLKVDPAIGVVAQAGVDFNVTDRWGLYLDVKKAYLRTEATATVPAFGGAPISADIKLDPLVFSAGLKARF